MLASGAALLAGGRARAQADTRRFDVHHATRNTLLGPAGLRWPKLQGRPGVSKAYPGRRRVTLPERTGSSGASLSDVVHGWPAPDQPEAVELTLSGLGRLLHLCNGVTTGHHAKNLRRARRAAPSAGALYSGEVYLVAAGIDGLEPGVYSYSVAEHALVELRRGAFIEQVAQSVQEPARVQGAVAAILLTNVFGRYTFRYANRGYRYALIDSGHIGENLRLAAASVGIREQPFHAFEDDRLNEMIDVDGREEAVCALHVLGPPRDERSREASKADRPLVERQEVAAPALTWAPIVQRYHAGTALVPARAGGPRYTPVPLVSRPGTQPGIRLPPLDPAPSMRVEDAIRIRRSTREFLPGSMALADLSYILEMAQGYSSLARSSGIELLLVVHRITAIEPGLYRYRPSDHHLQLERRGRMSRELVRVCLRQRKAGDAAAALLMVADLGPEGAWATDRRYRDLLLESGAIGQRIYLAAEACGHSARNLAAFVDSSLNEFLGLDEERRAVVHLTLVGPGD
jgi:SagB-type dehydrogenase family enzyme